MPAKLTVKRKVAIVDIRDITEDTFGELKEFLRSERITEINGGLKVISSLKGNTYSFNGIFVEEHAKMIEDWFAENV